MTFVERVRRTYDFQPYFENMRRAEDELMSSGKYARVSCNSAKHEGNFEIVDCIAVKPLTKEIENALKIKDDEQEDHILDLMRTYAVEPCQVHLSQEEFISKHLSNESPFPYSISSVERNMYRSGFRSKMLYSCVNPFDEEQTYKIDHAIERNLSKTSYTRWSGD